MRNWDSEWAVLSATERAAFREKSDATAALTRVFARYGAPDMELIARAETAESRWAAARAACDRFIAEFRKVA